MCLGIPMTVVAMQAPGVALCRDRHGAIEPINLMLVGELPPGAAVLVHLGTAHRLLDAAEVKPIEDALEALEASLNGAPFEHLFADLIAREPQLPAHLRAGEETDP
jgi:hydrogenase expression/formation protein HypC